MKRSKDKTPIPLVLVTLPKSEKDIFQLKHLVNVIITVESQHQKAVIRKCYRCQRFGHAQSRCAANPRCVFCAGNHHTYECRKDTVKARKCCNCGEEHTASFRGCKSWPKLKNQTKPVIKSTPPKNISFADATKGISTQNSEPAVKTGEMSLQDLFSKFNSMYIQMQEVALQLGKMFQGNSPIHNG